MEATTKDISKLAIVLNSPREFSDSEDTNSPRTKNLSKSVRMLAPVVRSPASLSPRQKTSFVIKAPCVFEAASHDIHKTIDSLGEISIETTISLISKYEMASETVKQYFPGARPSMKIRHIVQGELNKHHISPENTLFAQSICPDEINHNNGGISGVFEEYFGDSFHLGGLAGLPFTGSKGYHSLTRSVPDG